MIRHLRRRSPARPGDLRSMGSAGIASRNWNCTGNRSRMRRSTSSPVPFNRSRVRSTPGWQPANCSDPISRTRRRRRGRSWGPSAMRPRVHLLAGVSIQSRRLAGVPTVPEGVLETKTDSQGRYRLIGMGKGHGSDPTTELTRSLSQPRPALPACGIMSRYRKPPASTPSRSTSSHARAVDHRPRD